MVSSHSLTHWYTRNYTLYHLQFYQFTIRHADTYGDRTTVRTPSV